MMFNISVDFIDPKHISFPIQIDANDMWEAIHKAIDTVRGHEELKRIHPVDIHIDAFERIVKLENKTLF